MRAAFLDRDGVINEVVMRDGSPASPRSPAELVFCDGVSDAVRRLKERGLLTFVVTNQPDLARGLLDPPAHEAIMARVRSEVEPHDVAVCPHDDHHDCECRKPRPGMLEQLARRWDIDLEESYMIGDSWKDMDAGRAAGCHTVLIRRDYNAEVQAELRAVDLNDAVRQIVEGGRR